MRRNILLDDLHQPVLLTFVLGQAEGFDGTPERGERVLDLVCDVGGEALDGVDAAVERVRHLAERARQFADLVMAFGEVGYLRAGVLAAPHRFGGLRETAHGLRDGARQQNGKQDRHAERDEKDLKDGDAFGADDPVDVAAARGQHQRAENRTVALDRHGDGDDEFASFVDALHAGRFAAERAGYFLVHGAVLAASLAEAFEVAAGQEIERPLRHAIDEAALVRAFGGRKFEGNDLARRTQLARVEDEPAFLAIEPRAGARRQYETAQNRRGGFGIDRQGFVDPRRRRVVRRRRDDGAGGQRVDQGRRPARWSRLPRWHRR